MNNKNWKNLLRKIWMVQNVPERGQSNPNLLKSELSNERDQIFLIFLHDIFTNMCPRNGSERVQIGLTPNEVNF